MVRLGEVDQAMDEVIGFLSQTECDLQQLQYVYGDPKYVETHLKKLQLVQKDLRNQVRSQQINIVYLIRFGTEPLRFKLSI